jgi:DNA polymerase-3 subunit delta'
MPFSTLIGNESAQSALKRMVEHSCVPNTLLFSGPHGIGKARFALALAHLLMGASHHQKLNSGNHPDLHIYSPEGKAHLHSIDSIRSLIEEVGMPPFEAPVKVFILHDAHLMLPASSNALLKTLEEPHLDSYIILLTSEPESVLPTILSRCRKIPFFPIPEKEMLTYLEKELSQTPEQARKTAFLAHGSFARVHQMISQSQDEKQKILHKILAAGTADYPLFLKLCTELEAACGLSKTEENEESDSMLSQMDALFEEISTWYRDLYLVSQGVDRSWLSNPQFQKAARAPSLERVLEAIARARLALQRHLKLRVVLEELFYQLSLNH